MLITKLNLYNVEWLDLVFDHRNKQYGAYDLRQHYGRNMTKAMVLTFAGVAVLVAASIIFKPKPAELVRKIELPTDAFKIQPPPPKAELKKPDPVKPAAPIKPAAPLQTVRSLPPVVVPTEQPIDPPTTADLQNSVISNVTSKGTPGGTNALDSKPDGGNGDGVAPADNGVKEVGTLDVMPEPVGGAAAWAKFLQKNLRFPGIAQEQGVSGKVLLSFIIEKDGSLSNIKIERGAGYGFDEEALRVLKLAKAWKPGMQNNQPVRVRYNIPINFQLAADQ